MIEADQTTLSAPAADDSSKRRQILDGARKVFMDLGFDGASMGEIARAAGVSKGTLYVYFDDKIAAVRGDRRGGDPTPQLLFKFDPTRDVASNLAGSAQPIWL